MAKIDDLDQEKLDKQEEREWSKNSVKDLHFDGWDRAAVQGATTRLVRRKPKMLSKSFPQWSHFVELLLACYWLFIPLFYENILFGIPIMISSLGFWWVAIPGVRTSLAGWVSTRRDEPRPTMTSYYKAARSQHEVCEEKKDDDADDEMGETEVSSLLLHSKSCPSTVYWMSHPALPIVVV